jgi:protein-S-isoprenylcysteine O-methyltransferase Ste14
MTSSRTHVPALGPRGEGWTVLQMVFMVAILFASWWAARSDPNPDVPALAAWRTAGAVVLVAGLGVIVASSVVLRRSQSFSALPRPIATGSLVDRGPYRVVRHPLYAGLILAALGVTLIRMTPLVAALTVGLAVVLDLKRRREEAWLVDRFPGYAAYRSRTKALIPFVY